MVNGEHTESKDVEEIGTVDKSMCCWKRKDSQLVYGQQRAKSALMRQFLRDARLRES